MDRLNARAFLLLMLLIVATFPTGQAALLPAYDLVGEDPAADAVQPIATGANYPACGTGLSCGKYDITSLEMAAIDDVLHVKLNMVAGYFGTTSILYSVHFKVAGTSYFTCWNMQTAGTTGSTPGSNDVIENTLGCSRFTGTAPVGPATRAAGVETGTDAESRFYVLWPVPLSAIGDSASLTDVVAEVWARSVSTCCAGSTTQSQYLWNRADRAPNAETWAYSPVPSTPALSLNVTVEPNATTAGPSQTAAFAAELGLLGDGTANVSLSLEGLPEGWTPVTFENVSLGGENLTQIVEFTIDVPSDAPNATLNLTLNATSGEAGTVLVNITLTVDTSLAAPASSEAALSGTATSTAPISGNASAKAEESEAGVPGPGFAAGVVAFLVAAAAATRRRQW